MRGLKLARDIAVTVAILIVFYFAILGILWLTFGVSTPFMAVRSNSMKHADNSWREYLLSKGIDPSSFPFQDGFERGDLLIVRKVPQSEISVGDVIIYKRSYQEIPIVHRVIGMVKKNDEVWYVTKGDANSGPDNPVAFSEVVGKAIFMIPKIGYPFLWVAGE
jgi:signal peptidase